MAINRSSQQITYLQSSDRMTWEREYRDITAIPSSKRDNPSQALTEAVNSIDFKRIERVLDVGCGNGRNAIFIAKMGAHVTALDFSLEAMRLARKRVKEERISASIDLVHADFLDGSPIEENSFDLVVDSYVSCHFISPSELDQYYNQVREVLRPGGLVYWSGLSTVDGYYQRLENTHPGDRVVVDPLNGVAKRLYTRGEIADGLPISRETIETWELTFPDVVDGEEYRRVILSGLYRV